MQHDEQATGLVVMRDHTRAFAAEFLGTFALVFIGAGSVIVENHTGMSHQGLPDGKVSLLGIALAHGMTLMVMIYGLGAWSGGHFNPAVSIAVWMRKKLRAELLMPYILLQLAGGVLAALILAGLFPDEVVLAKLGSPVLAAKITPMKGIVIEALITFLLTLTVLLTTRDDHAQRGFAGLAIGSILVVLILFAGPFTGACANPARYFGPALVRGDLADLLVYLSGPVFGAVMASMTFAFLTALRTPQHQSQREAILEQARLGAMLERAYSLFRSGDAENAALALLPLLREFDACSVDMRNSVRTLLIVLEEEVGPVSALDPYRHLVHRLQKQKAASAEPNTASLAHTPSA